MKKILLFMLPVMALSLASCEKNNEKELSGDDVIEFKDPNFFKALLENGVDSNRDGVITVNEAMAVVDVLTIMECNVSDITEIKYFKSLEFLECIYNNLTTLDLSENTALELLDCFTNELTSINVSKNTALTWLDCGDNKLTSLDVKNNTALESLSCYYNQLTTLDVSNNVYLTELLCYENNLKTLDLRNNFSLTSLNCGGNPLTKIILSRDNKLDDESIQAIIEEYGNIIEYVD